MNNRVEKHFRDKCAGNTMRVALALLCIGAVAFLLRVLAALVREGIGSPAAVQVHFAKFNPSRRRGELIEMNLEPKRIPTRRGERTAI
jgi:hypothetical protein